MSMKEGECELTRLVPNEEDGQPLGKGDVTPCIISKVPATPSSPTSNKVSSSGGGSILGTGATSQASLSSKTMSKLPIGPSLTPVPGSNTRLLYVSEKLGNLSRRPSLLSDASCRTPKETKPTSVRMAHMKKEASPAPGSVVMLKAPPNTPSPSVWRAAPQPEAGDAPPDRASAASEASSLLTTKAVASEPEDGSDCRTSSETLHRHDKGHKPIAPLDSNPGTLNFSASSANLGSNSVLNFTDHLTYLRTTKSGHTGLRSVPSGAFLKSLWGKSQRSHLYHQHHCFISDITDVRQMEHALLQLLEDFHSGKLRAFAKDCSMEQMQGIREQQERLARLHFDLGAQQELYAPLSEEGLRANRDNMQQLMGSLEQLSLSIEKLQLFSKDSS